jgi:hypothetical protein
MKIIKKKVLLLLCKTKEKKQQIIVKDCNLNVEFYLLLLFVTQLVWLLWRVL